MQAGIKKLLIPETGSLQVKKICNCSALPGRVGILPALQAGFIACIVFSQQHLFEQKRARNSGKMPALLSWADQLQKY